MPRSGDEVGSNHLAGDGLHLRGFDRAAQAACVVRQRLAAEQPGDACFAACRDAAENQLAQFTQVVDCAKLGVGCHRGQGVANDREGLVERHLVNVLQLPQRLEQLFRPAAHGQKAGQGRVHAGHLRSRRGADALQLPFDEIPAQHLVVGRDAAGERLRSARGHVGDQ